MRSLLIRHIKQGFILEFYGMTIHHLHRLFGLMLLISLSAPNLACEQKITHQLLSLSLEELANVEVDTVSKTSESLYRAPGIASVISREEIRRFGGNSLYEVLDRIASVYMNGSILFLQNNAAIRGDMFNGLDRHVLILLNGRPFRDTLNGGIKFPIYTAFPLNSIKRLELIRGPSSVLYGSDAFSGVINIITRQQPDDACSEVEIAIGGGSFAGQMLEAFGSVSGNQFGISAGLQYFAENGWNFAAYDQQQKFDSVDMGEENYGLSLNAHSGHFHFNLAWLEAKQNYLGANLNWQEDHVQTRSHLLADLGYTYVFSTEQRLEANLTYNLSQGDANSQTTISFDSSVENTLLELTYHQENEALAWLMGGSVEYSKDRQLDYLQGGKLLINAQPAYEENIYTIYSQLNYQFTKNTQITLGGQSVKNPEQNWHFIPRIGLVHQFNSALGAKLLYSEAYRAATQVERNIRLPIVEGNPHLQPETVDTFDAQVFYLQEDYQFSLTYFHSRQEALILRQRIPSIPRQQHFNEGKVTLQGIEFESKYIPFKHWYLTGSITYQENKSGEGVEDYTLAPNWLLKTGISYTFTNGIELGLFNTYVSQAPEVNVRNPNSLNINPTAKAYNLTTLNLNMPLNKHQQKGFELNAYIYNLLDEDIYTPEINTAVINTVPAKAGRSAYVKLRYRF